MRGDGYGNTVGATLAVDRGRLINAPANVPEFSQKPTGENSICSRKNRTANYRKNSLTKLNFYYKIII